MSSRCNSMFESWWLHKKTGRDQRDTGAPVSHHVMSCAALGV